MGKTLTEWKRHVEKLLRDASNKDMDPATLITIGIQPALGRYSNDRPYMLVTESVGAGSAYFDLPVGWSAGFSRLEAVEHPARQDPPELLDPLSWKIVRKPTNVAVEQILLDRKPTASEHVRFSFTAPWPLPTDDAAIDKVDEVAFHAVSALSASLCCVHLAAEAARSRAGAIPTDFADGGQRARTLMEAAKEYKAIYEVFLGIDTGGAGGGDGGGSGMAPASRAFDFDPGQDSLFHGGRR